MEQHQDGVLAPRGVSKVGPAMAVAQTRRSELGVVAPPHNHTINTFLEGYAEQAEKRDTGHPHALYLFLSPAKT